MSSIIQQQGPAAPGGPAGRARSNYTWVIVVVVVLVIIALPTMILLFFGLLPSLVAVIIDRSKGHSASFCVFGLNFIGVFPYILELWGGENTINQGLNISTDIFSLLVMYSAAAFGWLLFMAAPQVISSFVLVLQERKVESLRNQQKTLIEEWGPEVSALIDEQAGLEPGQPHNLAEAEEKPDEEE